MSNKKFNLQIKPLNLLFLFIAGIINATGVMLFLSPAGVIDSGISGLSLFLKNVTGVNIAVFLVVFNVPLFLVGFRKLGWKFIVYSLVSIGAYSAMSALYQDVFTFTGKIYAMIEKDMFIASVFGGFISGVGSGLTIRYGGAIDGVEVLAVMFAKKIGVSVGQFVMAFNVIIYVVASVVSRDILVGLYSVISYAVGLKVVDFVVDGFDKGKACTIITKQPEKLAAAISAELKRGITIVDCKGYFLNEEQTMLYCVVNRFEITRIKNIIQETDPDSFVAINEVSEVLGNKVKFTRENVRKGKYPPVNKNLEGVAEGKAEETDNLNSEFEFQKDGEAQSAANADFGAIGCSAETAVCSSEDSDGNSAHKTE